MLVYRHYSGTGFSRVRSGVTRLDRRTQHAV